MYENQLEMTVVITACLSCQMSWTVSVSTQDQDSKVRLHKAQLTVQSVD